MSEALQRAADLIAHVRAHFSTVVLGAAFEVDPLDWSKLTPAGRPPSR